MAQHAAGHAEHPQVRLLAQQMHEGQASEIEVLQDMLVERGLAPEPEQAGAAGSTAAGTGSTADADGHGGHGGHG